MVCCPVKRDTTILHFEFCILNFISPLSLLMFGILARHKNPPASADHLALVTNWFNRTSHFHIEIQKSNLKSLIKK